MTTQTIETHTSKWGFHPCTRETCQKLKEAHLLLLRALRDIKRHQRWSNKLEPEGEEPKHPSFLVKDGRFYRSEKAKEAKNMTYGITLGTSYWPVGFRCEIHYYEHILSQYRNARRPQATEEEVEPLNLPDDLWLIIEKLKGFYKISPAS